jgi:hypothetical protein
MPAEEAASANAQATAAAPPSSATATGAPVVAAARAPAATAAPPATVNTEPPAARAAEANEPHAEAQPKRADELEAAAADWLQNRLPRISQAAERQLASAMGSAARSAEMRRRSEVRAAVQAARSSAAVGADVPVRAREARTLNEAALVAYWRDNSLADAVRLQTQAFGANPLDPEVVGNLAFLRLKEKPPHAETARQLALHALMLKDARFPNGRIEDWTTLAIADALTGRDTDARNAWFVSMALASDLQRQCDAAVSAEATYGERLRPSVQAMLQRARSSAAYGRCDVAAAATPSTQRKPARTQVKSKSTQRTRRAIP